MSFKLLQVDASLPRAGGEESPERARDCVSVSHDAMRKIEELPRRPLNLITIWGPARTGKSFFMNNLARIDNLFPVSGEVDPCTVGVDMAARTCGASSVVSGMTQGESSTSSPVIGFVDVEGSGDKHEEYDMLLATPLLLLSKVLFFNFKGRGVKTLLLGALARVALTASAIAETKRPNSFGHLVILLRDAPDDEESARRIIFDHEKPHGLSESEDAISSRMERNKTRERVKEAFQSVRVVCLPQPHKKINGHEEVKDTFKAKMDQVREHLQGMLHQPHLVGEHAVEGGAVFASLLEEVCTATNRRDKGIVPIRMMETVIKREVEKCRTEVIEHFQARIHELEDSTSSATETLKEAIEGHRNAALEEFRDKTQGRSETAIQAARVELEKRLGELSEGWRVRREEKIASAKSRVTAIMSNGHQEMGDQMQKIIGKIPVDEDAELRTMWEDASRSACTKVENEIQANFSEGVRADLGLSCPSFSVFQQRMEAEMENLINLNRRMKEEQAKYEARREEQERTQRELQSQHENEEKNAEKCLQAEREERESRLKAVQDEAQQLRSRNEQCEQEESWDFFQHVGQFFGGMFTGQ